MTLSPRDRRAIVGGGLLLLITLGAWYGLMPAWERWRAARELAIAQETSLESLTARLDRCDAMMDRLAGKFGPAVRRPVAGVEAVRAALPDEVQAMLGRAGVEYQSIELQSVQRLREAPGLTLVSVRVSATANPNAVAKLLALAAEADRVLLVDRLEMSRGERPDRWTLSVVFATPARGHEA